MEKSNFSKELSLNSPKEEIYLAKSCDNLVFPVPELPVNITKGLTWSDNK